MIQPSHQAIVDTLQSDFQREVQTFLKSSGIESTPSFQIDHHSTAAEPVYILTGASFTPFDPQKHGEEATHAFYESPQADQQKYLMNNTAAILQTLMKDDCRILLHTRSDISLTRQLVDNPRVHIIEGDLADPQILKSLYHELASMAQKQPISDVSMVLYQSFAQNNGEPFKPMHKESPQEVERACNRRLRFVYNMAAMGYDLLVNRGLDDLKILSLSALAANRASYGLLADAADKFMCELAWRTFHLESNISTGKPVSVFQINPGITTACDTYRDPRAMKTVFQESIADGFPLSDEIMEGKAPIPQLSAHDVAWVANALLRTPEGQNPNAGMPEDIRATLYGGFSPEELRRRLLASLDVGSETSSIDGGNLLPDHIITPGTTYGALPSPMRKGVYKRISMTPKGQEF